MSVSGRTSEFVRSALADQLAWSEVMSILNAASPVNTAELAVLDGVTKGTAAANKALVLDANKKISTISDVVATNVNVTNANATLVAATNVNATNVSASSTVNAVELKGTNTNVTNVNATLVAATNVNATNVNATLIGAINTNGLAVTANTVSFFGANLAAQPTGIANANNNADNLMAQLNSVIAALETLGLIATV